ncbi:MATE family efflux transporter [Fusobacterium vincentii]|uniref:MATE family efflux transporter n=1 Tax=Fusobacterium vincentii TaxID=155615 RepID=UPI0001D0A293|nr:MATE family efflux transporter [Fusobacterium vincentii]EFG33867.1 MATE efflux family protein [Fusobacterium vincentii 3_1_27]BEO93312.1 MATE family efflux transporter [Fusobacterium nucleatum]BEP06239.1 MATE family efflux transporter [Fusobacterium nucleatum]
MDISLKNNNLTEGKIWKVMLRFVLPIFLGTLFQSLYNTIDAIIVGRFAGKEALAAIESVLNFHRLPVSFFVGLSSGATIIISQYFGANKKDEVSKASHTAILFAIVGGLLLSVLSCILSPFFIRLIKVPEEIFYQAQIYTIICFSGIMVSMIYNIGSGILRALGDSKTPFYILIVSNILNIILDLILVVVFNLGVIGVGFATLISQIASAILIFIILLRTKLDCKIYINKICFYKKYLKEIFRLGLPIGVQSVLYPISNTIIQSSINTFGVNSIAAWAISGKLDFLIWTVSDAFSIAISTFVAQNYGAEKHQRARNGIKAALIMSMVTIFVISSILYLYNKPLAYFLIDDKNIVDLTSKIIKLIAPLYFIYVIGDVLSGAIRGIGDTFNPMIINIFGICVCRVLWIFFIVPLNPTFFMVLYGFIVSWIITAIMYIIYIVYKRKSF